MRRAYASWCWSGRREASNLERPIRLATVDLAPLAILSLKRSVKHVEDDPHEYRAQNVPVVVIYPDGDHAWAEMDDAIPNFVDHLGGGSCRVFAWDYLGESAYGLEATSR